MQKAVDGLKFLILEFGPKESPPSYKPQGRYHLKLHYKMSPPCEKKPKQTNTQTTKLRVLEGTIDGNYQSPRPKQLILVFPGFHLPKS